MKSITIAIRIILLFAFASISNAELYGQNITLKTQAEVNSFNQSTTIIDGNLQIGFNSGLNDPTNITDLSSLENLVHISGKLTIIYNPNLESLNGLHHLDSIGALSFSNNDLITDFDELVELENIGSDIFISGNNALVDISQIQIGEIIGGKLTISGNENLSTLPDFDHVTEASGITISSVPISTLDIFHNLEVVHGDLTITSNYSLVEIDGFSKLRSIDGKLSITSCSAMDSLNAFNNLESINEGFRVYSCQGLVGMTGFSKLSEIGGDFEVSFNYALIQIEGLNSLASIGGGIFMSSNHDIIGIDFLQGIDEIGGSLYLHSNSRMKSLLPLINLKAIPGNLTLTQNYDLPNLEGLNNIQSIEGDFEIFNQRLIRNIDIFNNLESITGNIKFQGNTRLANIDGLKNLTAFDQKIEITYNDALFGVDGLSNLSTCKGIEIDNNDNLLQINGLSGMKEITGSVRIFNNPLLNGCCAIRAIQLDPTVIVTGSVTIFNNGPECDQTDIETCDFDLVKGEVFYDQNENTTRDINEFGIPNIPIQYIDTTNYSLTFEDGKFYLPVEKDSTYLIKPIIPNDFFITTDYTDVELTFVNDTSLFEEYAFGIAATDSFCRGEVNTFLDRVRCNSVINCNVKVQNLGSELASGILRINFHEAFDLVSPELLAQDSLGYYIVFDSLYPFQSHFLDVSLNGPDVTFIGDTVDITASLYYEKGLDSLMLMDETAFESLVFCSYDPNDKQVMPIGLKEESYTLIEDELLYTVRFQNTGNAPAIDVTILDTLDQNLDLSTFAVVRSSHNMVTSLTGNAVQFLFKDIWLIDSLTNDEESQGFLQYSIKAFANTQELTEINNTAHIIFDSNPAIITNTTKNTMVESICCDVFVRDTVMICEGEMFLDYTDAGDYELVYEKGTTCDSIVMLNLIVLPNDDPLCTVSTNDSDLPELVVVPNPFQESLQAIVYDVQIKSMKLYNIQGSVVATQFSKDGYMDTKSLSSGLYFLEVKYENGTYRLKKVIKY